MWKLLKFNCFFITLLSVLSSFMACYWNTSCYKFKIPSNSNTSKSIPFPISKLKKSLLMYWNWMQYQIYLSCRIFLAVFFFIYLPPKVDSSLLKVYWWWWSTLWRLIEIPKKNSATLFFLNRESNPKDLDRQSYMLTARPTKQPCLGFFLDSIRLAIGSKI